MNVDENRENAALAAWLGSRVGTLADEVSAAYVQRWPETSVDRSTRPRDRERDWACLCLTELAEALASGSVRRPSDGPAWGRLVLTKVGLERLSFEGGSPNGGGLDRGALALRLQCAADVLAGHGDAGPAAWLPRFLRKAAVSLRTVTPLGYLEGEGPLRELARAYLRALLAGDRRRACDMILEAADCGVRIADIYLEVFQRVQWEIGRLWELNRITVAQEHFCTAATQLVIAQLYPRIIRDVKPCGKTILVAAVAGDLHELGARMVADFFEMAGWNAHYLGANTPTPSVVAWLKEHPADAVAISASMTEHVGTAAELVRSIRRGPRIVSGPILVGGNSFNGRGELWKDVGADGSAPDAAEAVTLAERLTAAAVGPGAP